MTRILFFFMLVSVGLLACKETNQGKTTSTDEVSTTETKKDTPSDEQSQIFEEIDVDEINDNLRQQSVDLSAKEVMKLFYPYEVEEGAEGNESILISEPEVKNQNTMVSLVHDNMMDDSVKATQYQMTMQKEDGKWKVISIKKNWKCWEGRGHPDWGTDMCG